MPPKKLYNFNPDNPFGLPKEQLFNKIVPFKVIRKHQTKYRHKIWMNEGRRRKLWWDHCRSHAHGMGDYYPDGCISHSYTSWKKIKNNIVNLKEVTELGTTTWLIRISRKEKSRCYVFYAYDDALRAVKEAMR